MRFLFLAATLCSVAFGQTISNQSKSKTGLANKTILSPGGMNSYALYPPVPSPYTAPEFFGFMRLNGFGSVNMDGIPTSVNLCSQITSGNWSGNSFCVDGDNYSSGASPLGSSAIISLTAAPLVSSLQFGNIGGFVRDVGTTGMPRVVTIDDTVPFYTSSNLTNTPASFTACFSGGILKSTSVTQNDIISKGTGLLAATTAWHMYEEGTAIKIGISNGVLLVTSTPFASGTVKYDAFHSICFRYDYSGVPGITSTIRTCVDHQACVTSTGIPGPLNSLSSPFAIGGRTSGAAHQAALSVGSVAYTETGWSDAQMLEWTATTKGETYKTVDLSETLNYTSSDYRVCGFFLNFFEFPRSITPPGSPCVGNLAQGAADRGVITFPSFTSTNTHNRDLTNAVWTKTNMSCTRTGSAFSNDFSEISGGASFCQSSAANGTVIHSTNATGTNAMFYFKGGGGTVEYTVNNGSTWNTITESPFGGWQLVSPLGSEANEAALDFSGVNSTVKIGFRTPSNGTFFRVDFVSVFDTSVSGEDEFYPDPVIVDSTSVSHAWDQAYIDMPASPPSNPSVLEASYTSRNISLYPGGNTFTILSTFTDGTLTFPGMIGYVDRTASSNFNFTMKITDGGVSTVSFANPNTAMTFDPSKYNVKFQAYGTTQNVKYNDTVMATGSFDGTPGHGTKIWIGSQDTTENSFAGYISNICLNNGACYP